VSITDAAGGATAIAFAGLLFAAAGAASGGGYIAALALTSVLALLAIPIAFRARERR